MRTFILVQLCLQFFTFQNPGSKETRDNGYSWLNIKYVECLKNGLPCECEKLVQTYYSLVLDTNKNSKNYGVAISRFEQIEPFIYPINRMGFNKFEILKKEGTDTSWAKLIIKGDSLYFIENNVLSKFIKSDNCKVFDAQHHMVDNVKLLNESLAVHGYQNLERIVNHDSLRCECNKWMGNINVLFVKGGPQSWILEIRDDSLQIRRIINVDKDPDDAFQTEKLINYKWNKIPHR